MKDGDKLVEEWRVAESLQVLECLAANRDILRAKVWLELYRLKYFLKAPGLENKN